MKKHLLLFTSFSLSLTAFAQDFPGYSTSNYAGVNGIDVNPANIADSRFKVDATVTGFSIGFANNYVGMKKSALKRNGSLFHPDSSTYPAFNDKNFQNDYLIERNNSDNKSVWVRAQLYMPSAMVALSQKASVAFTWRIRSYTNVDGVEPNLAHQIYESLKDSAQWLQSLTNKQLSIQTMTWAEYGATYARVLKQDNEHFIKVGARGKLLQGLAGAYLFVDNLKYMFTNNDTLTLINTDVSYGHSANFEFTSNNLKYVYDSKLSFGMDLGIVYEYRPNYKDYKYDMDCEKDLWMKWKNKYKFKAGFAVLDLGAVKFQKAWSNNFTANVNNWNIHPIEFKPTTDSATGTTYPPITNWDDTLRKRFGFQKDKETSFTMHLPTVLSAQFDYNIWKDLYLNLNIYYAIQYNAITRVHDITTYSLVPRYDWKWFGIFFPFSYDAYKNTKLGMDVRLGPIIIGTSNLAPFVGSRDIYSADIHFIAKVPIMHRPVKDRDKDHVSDKRDLCPDVPGVCEFWGCPDRDGDHIQDSKDKCPDDPGLPQFEGCPDRDGDGIIDKDDDCPDTPGLAKFRGCPDKDGDGIPDKDDDCPDVPGIPQFKGCPDTDGDGIKDSEDKCPTVPGPIENHGCPYDKLVLVDKNGNEIKSVNVNSEGKFIFESLPTDSLAIFKLVTYDENSMKLTQVPVGTPSTTVKLARKGADNLFRFDIIKPDPNKIKPITLSDEEMRIVKKAFDNLEFETAKAIIKPTSFDELNELAGLLKKKAAWRLMISGHTDNQGGAAYNMNLSKNRANALADYLAKQGIDKSRFVVKWYGQTKPIAPNTTPQGRQKNRRVEMLIIE